MAEAGFLDLDVTVPSHELARTTGVTPVENYSSPSSPRWVSWARTVLSAAGHTDLSTSA